MRLLDAEALIYDNVAELVEFTDESSAPPYAILSHTWEEEEVLFADIPLGPQHEIHLSAASRRAQQRRRAMSISSTDTSVEDDSETDSSDSTTRDASDTDISDAKHSDASVSNSESNSESKGGSSSSISIMSTSVDSTSGCGTVAYARNAESRPISPHVKAGWNKILNACLQTLRDGLSHIWIDTCCINKSSSAELSEAINSMYRWYEYAIVCYVYLSDCPGCPETHEAKAYYRSSSADHISKKESSIIRRCIGSCRWFTRGWTLQELIAPRTVFFFDWRWHSIARRDNIWKVLRDITGIHSAVLCPRIYDPKRKPKDNYSIAQKMFWASKRKTTRKEDEAYSLLGLFDVNIPLLYGEGARSFERLQQEIIRISTDQSILAWDYPENAVHTDGPNDSNLLAPSLKHFGGKAQHIEAKSSNHLGKFRFTNEGIEMTAGLEASRVEHGFRPFIAVLNCAIMPESNTIGVWIKTEPNAAAELRTKAHVRKFRAVFASRRFTPSKTRLIELREVELFGGHTNYRILVVRSMSDYIHWGIDSYSSWINKITIVFGRGDSPWVVVGSYPPNHLKVPGSMLFPATYPYGAVAIQHLISGEQFAVVVCNISSSDHKPFSYYARLWNSETRGTFGTGYIYWLMQEHPHDGNVLNWQRLQPHFKQFCDRISKYESLDYFERTTKRRDSRKHLILSNGECVTAGCATKLDLLWIGERARDTELVLHIEHNKNLTRAIKPL